MPPRALTFRLPAGLPPVETGYLNLGHYPHPRRRLEVDSRHLVLDGQPWMPVMGEFHYSRYPADEWETELRLMRAGGIEIVASYVIWNHHEPHAGQYRWDGQRSLRTFVETAARCGLMVYLRPGPWSHAEVRQGGFPDWLLGAGPLRRNAPAYLGHVRRFFGEVGAQVRGLLWCDGGPVVGVQLENEYGATGPGCGAEHIAVLKDLAIEAGLKVPLYTVTGWPTLDIPPREVLPVSGAYADGFWSGARGPLPPSGVFVFNTQRVIGEMGNVDGTPAAAHVDKSHYPFFLAEAGGGMHQSYHRRPVVTATDVHATALVQLGSGATLYGYYMFHGGTNPVCETGPLNETQATGYPNDVPEWGYDFHAPLGQYGQVRPSWGRLRCLHLFMQAFGPELARAEPLLPEGATPDPSDLRSPRVAWRGVDDRGFLFVNHHVRHHPMAPQEGLQVRLEGPGRTASAMAVDAGADAVPQVLPAAPFALRPGDSFIWPVGQPLGAARLRHATVQPLTTLPDDDSGGGPVWVGFWLPGQAIEFCFDLRGLQRLDAPAASEDVVDPVAGTRTLRLPPAATDAPPRWIALVDAGGRMHRLLVLSPHQARSTARLRLAGRERLMVSSHPATWDDDGRVTLHRPSHEPGMLRLFPVDGLHATTGRDRVAAWDGFWQLGVPAATPAAPEVGWTLLREPQAPPPLRWGPPVAWRDGPVPLMPEEADHAREGLWQLLPPADVHPADGRLLVAVRYRGDMARLHRDGVVVDDHFHDGDAWWLGLDRHAKVATSASPASAWPTFTLGILSRADDLPIFLEDDARAEDGRAAVLSIDAALWRTDTFEPAGPAPARD